MHITKQKLSWYIYSRKYEKYIHGTWSLLNILMIFGIKYIVFNFDPYFWLFIPVLFMTGFVVQGHTS